MIVVSDTSPLNYLAIIENVSILPALFGEVVIPTAVAKELTAAHAPEQARALIEKRPGWLVVRSPQEATLLAVRSVAPKLGVGELEAISLAKDLHAELLLTDERRATRVARDRHHLRVTGLLGVLELASVRGLIDLRTVIARLERTTFRIPRSLVDQLLEADARRRGSSP